MTGFRTSSGIGRAVVAAVLALILAVRLLGPAGFMPAFEHGAVSIVACPDGDMTSMPMGHHHHPGDHGNAHQPCPYAAASALGASLGELPLLAAILVIGLALLIGRPFTFLERHRAHERPPLRGPPIPA